MASSRERFTKQRNNKTINELFSINNKTVIEFYSNSWQSQSNAKSVFCAMFCFFDLLNAFKHAKWYFASDAIKPNTPANLIWHLQLYFAISQSYTLMLNVTTDESRSFDSSH